MHERATRVRSRGVWQMICTLSYEIRIGLQDATAAALRVRAIQLDLGELDLLGLAVVSDTTIASGPHTVERSVELETLPGSPLVTADELIQATRSLLRGRLNLLSPGWVVAAEPVITP
jgi:hypothetical protein